MEYLSSWGTAVRSGSVSGSAQRTLSKSEYDFKCTTTRYSLAGIERLTLLSSHVADEKCQLEPVFPSPWAPPQVGPDLRARALSSECVRPPVSLDWVEQGRYFGQPNRNHHVIHTLHFRARAARRRNRLGVGNCGIVSRVCGHHVCHRAWHRDHDGCFANAHEGFIDIACRLPNGFSWLDHCGIPRNGLSAHTFGLR